jgi:hypothetical protein
VRKLKALFLREQDQGDENEVFMIIVYGCVAYVVKWGSEKPDHCLTAFCLQALTVFSSSYSVACWMTPSAEHRETMRLVPAGAEVTRYRKVLFGSFSNSILGGLPCPSTWDTNSIIFFPHAAAGPWFIICRISHRLIISGVSDPTLRGMRHGGL